MPTRVIVEGPDGAGKTNLVNALVRETHLPIKDRASSTQGPITELAAYVDEDLLSHLPQESGIYDRHPLISEPIYGPLIRGHMQFSVLEDIGYDWLVDRLQLFYNYRPILIYCLPPFYVVNDNVHRSEQMGGVTDRIRPIYDLYAMQYARDFPRGRVHRWDYTAPYNLDSIIRDIKTYARPVR